MQEARARFDLSVYGCWEEEEDSSVFEVTIDEIGTNTDSASFETAWNDLLNNCDSVERSLRAELQKHHELGWSGFQRDLSDETEGWEEICNLVDWESPLAIDSLYGLEEICLGPEIRDECAVITFRFASSWDTEHGVEISLHRGILEN